MRPPGPRPSPAAYKPAAAARTTPTAETTSSASTGASAIGLVAKGICLRTKYIFAKLRRAHGGEGARARARALWRGFAGRVHLITINLNKYTYKKKWSVFGVHESSELRGRRGGASCRVKPCSVPRILSKGIADTSRSCEQRELSARPLLCGHAAGAPDRAWPACTRRSRSPGTAFEARGRPQCS